MKPSFHRGHEIIVDNELWLYKDNNKPVKLDPNRKCNKCKKENTLEDHDPCLAGLPGVINACCGHGTDEGYIQFKNGITIRGKFKIEGRGEING